VEVDIPGSWPNGATINIQGGHATIRIHGIDSVSDLETIFQAARANGATSGVLRTGVVVDPAEHARYQDLIERGQTRFGGRVKRIGPKEFEIEFDELPEF
jgi:hypothetical protein